MQFTKDLIYESTVHLFQEHDAETPSQYAREACKRTRCGVNTAFLLADGTSICSADLTPLQDTAEFAARHFVGVQHGTVMEGEQGEWMADPCLFPFSDEELADAWQYLEDCPQ